MFKKKIFIVIVALALMLTACSKGNTPSGTFVGGHEGIVAKFTPGMPPAEVFDNSQMTFAIQTALENKGESDIPAGALFVEIKGISPTSFGKNSQADFKKTNPSIIKGTKKNFAGDIINGDTAWITFDNLKYVIDLPGNQGFSIVADICYLYETRATAKICVNRDIIKNSDKEKICTLSGEKEVQNSGAPIAITSVKEDPIGGGKVQLNIVISHVGPGDGFFKKTEQTCDMAVDNQNKYKVYVEVTPNIRGVTAHCNNLDEGSVNSGYITLIDGQPRTLTCILDLNPVGDSVFEELVNFKLSYRYLQHITTPLEVKDVSGSS